MIVVAGESLVDLLPAKGGREGVLTMEAHAGGSPYNCAIALSKLGVDTGFLCPFSTDGFGELLLNPLREAGVAPLIKARSSAPTTLAVVTLDPQGKAQYQFYRNGTADSDFTLKGLIAALPARPRVLQLGGFCAVTERDADIWLDLAAEAMKRGALITMDPNLRPALAGDLPAYRARLNRFFNITHFVKLSDEDLEVLDPDKDMAAHARNLLGRRNCGLVVVTRGAEGSVAYNGHYKVEVPVYAPAEFGDTVGAGDSLMAGVLAALSERGALAHSALDALSADALHEILQFGAVVAGLNCARTGCHPPSRTEVDAVFTAG
ncbi:carbohydrate kinase family protein [Cucumibacter marinus]|uniref:carbohydrate kinase family protein n=1 Tax=Cucumibacter marinus TaxID=1121252 RepID=UPI0004181714|nr:carbohydrate kinase [Cucumibacter marinus]